MRMAFVVNNYPPRTGGVELHVHALAQELSAQGHEIRVITLGDEPGIRTDGAVVVHTLPERFRVADTLGFPPLGTRRRLTRTLRKHRADVVSVHTRFFPMSTVGLRAARAARIPVIHTEHGSDHVATDSALIRIASLLVDKTVGRWELRRADRVLGVSEAVVDFVRRLAGVQAQVFYNAIGPVAAPPTPTPQDLYRTVFVGRLVPGKGWDTYLDALADLRRAGLPLTGDLVGDGPDMPRVIELLRARDLEAVVTVHGRLPQEEVRHLLRGATLVNPTLLSEGFQTTLLESAIEGGRAVTYPVPGARLLAMQHAPVVVTEDRSAPALARSLTEHMGTAWTPAPSSLAEAWTWPARAREYAEVCRSVLAG